ncbi:AbrB/MazE/SpoVT family DNA-binding domain-containing protein [Candidatus Woesearchaeota archaeon]|nr:AbrB/MazE/SpoVT family DNA-binding domain-containing protein [Candidatus Woesearchaeota archaeon]
MAISSTKISANGQIVIPSDIRKKAKIKEGETFLIYVTSDGEIRLITEEKIRKKIGK